MAFDVAALLLAAVVLVSCAASDPGWVGRDQDQRVQTALASCLAERGVAYQPVVVAPGSFERVVPTPEPAAWWADQVGYGLTGEPRVERSVDPTDQDPNRPLLATAAGRDQLGRALYGRGGSPASFDGSGCFSRSLRAAGFYGEDRAGSGYALPGDDDGALLDDPAVAAARRRFRTCLRRTAGIDRDDPQRALRERFRRAGLLDAAGEVRADAGTDELADARALERRVAVADVGCQRSSGLDRAVDRAIRSTVDAERGSP